MEAGEGCEGFGFMGQMILLRKWKTINAEAKGN